MAYIQKISITVPGTSKHGVGASSYIVQGIIEAIDVLADATNPFVAGSSAIIKIRTGSTIGRLLFRSSSGLGLAAAHRYYYPRKKISNSTAATGTSSLSGKMPLFDETLYIIRQGSATGTTQRCTVNVYLS